MFRVYAFLMFSLSASPISAATQPPDLWLLVASPAAQTRLEVYDSVLKASAWPVVSTSQSVESPTLPAAIQVYGLMIMTLWLVRHAPSPKRPRYVVDAARAKDRTRSIMASKPFDR